MLRAFFWFYSQGSLLAVFRGAGGETQVRRKRGARQMFYSRYYLSTSFSSPICLMFYFVIGSHWVVLETTSSSVLQVGARKVPGKKKLLASHLFPLHFSFFPGFCTQIFFFLSQLISPSWPDLLLLFCLLGSQASIQIFKNLLPPAPIPHYYSFSYLRTSAIYPIKVDLSPNHTWSKQHLELLLPCRNPNTFCFLLPSNHHTQQGWTSMHWTGTGAQPRQVESF